ncbi:MAG: DoxX family membrane protein [Pyrinomonadaceae bacterium]|nr:DoxX family membrane protein [Pyrinomonadaceae bacterium]
MKYLLAVLFVLAGVNHFLNPEFYLKMMPPYLPWHLFLVYVSGVFEIVLGALLLIPRFTRIAVWGIIMLLVAVFPANIHMAVNPQLYPEINPLALWIRLPFQLVLIAWAYWFTRLDMMRGKKQDVATA